MGKLGKILLGGALVMGMALGSMSCEKGPAEKIGEKIDKGVQNTKDAAKDVKDDINKKR